MLKEKEGRQGGKRRESGREGKEGKRKKGGEGGERQGPFTFTFNSRMVLDVIK